MRPSKGRLTTTASTRRSRLGIYCDVLTPDEALAQERHEGQLTARGIAACSRDTLPSGYDEKRSKRAMTGATSERAGCPHLSRMRYLYRKFRSPSKAVRMTRTRVGNEAALLDGIPVELRKSVDGLLLEIGGQVGAAVPFGVRVDVAEPEVGRQVNDLNTLGELLDHLLQHGAQSALSQRWAKDDRDRDGDVAWGPRRARSCGKQHIQWP